MSYILSALNRAEQQRRGDGGNPPPGMVLPALAPAIHDTSAGTRLHRRFALMITAVVLVAALVWIVLLWLETSRPSIPKIAPPVAEVSPAVSAAPAPVAIAPSPSPPLAAIPSYTESHPADAPASEAQPDAAPPLPERAPLAIEQAPSPPPLDITGYIFIDSNPAASKLFVGGLVHRQGSSPLPGMVIREFHRDRVVVDYRGQRLALPTP